MTREALAGELYYTAQCVNRIESKPKYQAVLGKLARVAESTEAAAYSDNTVITDPERRVLQAFVAEIQFCRPAVDRFQGTPFQDQARTILTVWNQQQSLYQQLLSGQVTWAVFNKRSAESTGQLGAVMAALSREGPLLPGGGPASAGPGGGGKGTTTIVDLKGTAPGGIRSGQGASAGGANAWSAAGGASGPDFAAGGAFLVHLASYRSSATAQSGWQELVQRYGPLFQSLRPVTATVSVPGKGDFVRLLAGTFGDAGQADRFCANLKQRGHDFCQPVATR